MSTITRIEGIKHNPKKEKNHVHFAIETAKILVNLNTKFLFLILEKTGFSSFRCLTLA